MDNQPVLITRPNEFEAKIERFAIERMRVVADFDSTITTHNGFTSWALIKQIEELTPDYHREAQELYSRYQPYENANLPPERRRAIMEEWWRRHLGLFEKYKIRSHQFDQIDVSRVGIREGIGDAFHFFSAHNIPVLILSAGVAQTIHMVLDSHQLNRSNVIVTANELLFNEYGEYIGVNPPGHIHAGNKDEQHASRTAQSTFKDRTHILLLGDNLDDIKMIQPHERPHTIAIGYCTTNRQNDIARYREVFDIVVASDDGDMGVIKEVLQRIGRE